MQHICGASGFGLDISDTCPACEENRPERSAAAFARIEKAIQDLDVQIAIARAADCCVPDVRDFLRARVKR
jgi:hypothetical protein